MSAASLDDVARNMTRWLEDQTELSEEWKSEPRSLSPASHTSTTVNEPHKNGSTAAGRTSKPRTPARQDLSSISLAGPSQPQKVLAEKTESDANKIPSSALQKGSLKDPKYSRSSSAASAHSLVQQETMARRSKSSSPARKTPEWKQLAMRAAEGGVHQQDLFSPIGLEGIFNRPAQKGARRTSASAQTGFKLWQDADMPSSPPPWPAKYRQNEHRLADATLHAHQPSRLAMSQIAAQHNEVTSNSVFCDNHVKREAADQLNNTHNIDMSEGLRRQGRALGPFSTHDTPSSETLVQNYHSTLPDRSAQVHRDLNGLYLARSTAAGIDKRVLSNAASTTGSSHVSSFSPVFVSKHNSSDGQIRYSAIDSVNPSQLASIGGTALQGADISSAMNGLESSVKARNQSGGEHVRTVSATMAPMTGFVSTERGGQQPSNDSFMHRPLSPSVSSSVFPSDSISQACYKSVAVETTRRIDQDQYNESHPLQYFQTPKAVAADSRPEADPSPSTPPNRHRKQLSSSSPLKLFGNYDTFTNGRLLDRMCQFDNTDLPLPGGSEERFCSGNETVNGIGLSLSPTKRRRREESTSTLKTAVLASSQAAKSGIAESSPQRMSRSRTDSLSSLDSVANESVLVKMNLEDTKSACPLKEDEGLTLDPIIAKRPAPPFVRHPTPKRQRTLCKNDQIPAAEYLSATMQEGFRGIQDAFHQHGLQEQISATTVKHDSYPNHTAATTVIPQETANLQDDLSFVSLASQLEAVCNRVQGDSEVRQELAPPEVLNSYVLASGLPTLRLQKNIGSIRKHSVSTQDYVDEAMKIMDLIRSRRGHQSLLGTGHDDADVSDLGYTNVDPLPAGTLSRPLSRNEGLQAAWRSRDGAQPNARVLSHLRKYEETGDESFIMSSILKAAEGVRTDDTSWTMEQAELCSDPNIRIIQAQRQDLQPSAKVLNDEDVATIQGTGTETRYGTGSTDPSTNSTERTVQSISSQRNKSLPVIRPHKVTHLIQTEQAGMRFDVEKQAWIRCRIATTQHELKPTLSSSAGTDDDPLGQIPDLSVNEFDEVGRVHAVSRTLGPTPSKDPKTMNTLSPRDAIKYYNGLAGLSPIKEPLGIPATRPAGTTLQNIRPQPIFTPEVITLNSPRTSVKQTPMDHSLEARPTIGVLSTSQVKKYRPSVCFSYPLVAKHRSAASVPQRDQGSDDESIDESSSDEIVPETISRTRIPVVQSAASKEALPISRWNNHESATNHNMSLSRIDEHHELSIVETRANGRNLSLTLSVSTPVHSRSAAYGLVHPSSGLKNGFSFHSLSPLSEFTMHQDDRPHLVSQQLVRSTNHSTYPQAAQVSAVVVSELVENLQDVEPDEPYWDWIQSLNLDGKRLSNLHMLEEFCPRLEELNASRNCLVQLSGAPYGLRRLDASCNRLTSMVDWSPFVHLQYLDISQNDINSLDSLHALIHLRELNVDDNKIISLDGILDLDGLLKLSMRRNDLHELDLGGAGLKKLHTLNLAENKLTELGGLECLPDLVTLDVSHNDLKAFPTSSLESSILPRLHTLYCKNNELQTMDVSHCPRLEHINADNNRLTRVDGIMMLQKMRTLSLRGQTACISLSACVNDFRELCHLYLSDNAMQTFPITTPFLNLQTLELASTGLQNLPRHFSALAPNLRTVNFNSNTLKDLRPLKGIVKLTALHLAANRISRVRKTMSVLETLKSLTVLDLRDNPFSLSFHAHILTAGTVEKHPLQSLVPLGGEERAGVPDAALKHVLPPSDLEGDHKHRGKLDSGTRLRRRVYELLLATKCQSLRRLDGLEFVGEKVTVKDETWSELVMMGIIEPRVSQDV